MFTQSVSITVERGVSSSRGVTGFVAGDTDTTFANMVSEDDWKSYAKAFAAET